MRTPIQTAILASAVFAAAPAAAQQQGDFVVWPDVLLEANSEGSGYMTNGVGAPAVVWDPNLDRYLMVFEVNLPETSPDCPVGMWGLGIAYSDVGAATGWVAGPEPLLEPTAGTFYACVAAHPTVMYNANTSTMSVWFKAEQTDPPDAAIGPNRYTGVGQIRVKFRTGGGIQSVTVEPSPVLQLDQDFGMPKVIRKGGTDWEMMLTLRPDAWMATGTTSSAFTLDPEPVLTADPNNNPYWALDELFNAALVCEKDITFPYSTFIGGRDLGANGEILAAGWGKAISSDTDTWFLGADPYFEWSGPDEWRHWDVLRVDDPGGTEYLVWFDEKDANGHNQVRFATTIDTWNTADIYDKDCL